MLSVAVVFVLGYFDITTNSYLSTFLIQGVVMLAMPILLYSLFISKSVKPTLSDFGFKKISLTILICSILLGFVLFFVNNYVANIFYFVLSIFGYDGSINVSLSVGNIGVEFLLTAIIPGFCEEILHRGLIMRGSIKQGYTRYGLLFSSILFGLMHLNIQQFFYAMILGALMGFVVIVADSIYPAMIIHFMNNALSIYFSYGSKHDWPLVNFKASIEDAIFSTNFILCVAILCGVIVALLGLYRLLVQIIIKSKHRQMALKLAKDLNMENMSYSQLQSKLTEVDTVLKRCAPDNPLDINKCDQPLKFVDNIFLYSSLVLGALITICSFIWGIL